MRLHLMPKPTIAMVGGPAVGAGCSLAAACDLRFASDDAVFSAGFLPNGLAGDYGGSFFWTRIGGTGLARRLYLLNEKIEAPEALALGMVHAVVAPEQLRSYTDGIAHQLVQAPASALALVKDNLNAAEDEVERRRWLFAHEAENQRTAGHALVERLARRRGRSQTGLPEVDCSRRLTRRYLEDGDAVECVGVGAGRCDTAVPAGERRSPDAAARGPLQTATVAAMPHRTVPAMTPPRTFLIHALSSRNI